MPDDRCPLPRHDGRARLAPDDAGDLALICDCLGDCLGEEMVSPLSMVWWAIATGESLPRKLSASYRYVWRMFLAGEVGLIVPDPVEELREPRNQWPTVRSTWDLFRWKLGLERALGGSQPTPLTWQLVLWWLNPPGRPYADPDVEKVEAQEAIKTLRQEGVIHGHRDGDHGPLLYVPGDGSPDPSLKRR